MKFVSEYLKTWNASQVEYTPESSGGDITEDGIIGTGNYLIIGALKDITITMPHTLDSVFIKDLYPIVGTVNDVISPAYTLDGATTAETYSIVGIVKDITENYK